MFYVLEHYPVKTKIGPFRTIAIIIMGSEELSRILSHTMTFRLHCIGTRRASPYYEKQHHIMMPSPLNFTGDSTQSEWWHHLASLIPRPAG